MTQEQRCELIPEELASLWQLYHDKLHEGNRFLVPICVSITLAQLELVIGRIDRFLTY